MDVLPFITFLLGLSYSWLAKHFDKRRTIINMKHFLSTEIFRNFGFINEIANPDPEDETDLDSEYIVVMIDGIVTSVFDTYMDRLHMLKTSELDRIVDAYHGIYMLKYYGNKADYNNRHYYPELEARIEAGKDLIDIANGVTNTFKDVLLVFENGKEFLQSYRSLNSPNEHP